MIKQYFYNILAIDMNIKKNCFVGKMIQVVSNLSCLELFSERCGVHMTCWSEQKEPHFFDSIIEGYVYKLSKLQLCSLFHN